MSNTVASKENIRLKRHRHPEYRVWESMKRRCFNASHEHFQDYGGRGITVCEKWRDSFESFLDDVGSRPSMQHTLDRIDNDGNYEPGNVEWSTPAQQMRNRRDNRFITALGKSMIAADWAMETGIGLTTIRERLKRGWSGLRAVTEPVKTKGVRK